MDIGAISIVIWIVAILMISLCLVIVLGSKNLSSRVFASLSFITALWTISQGVVISTHLVVISDLLIRFQHFLGLLISFGFFFFSKIYPNDKKISLKSLILPFSIIIIFFYLYFFTNYLIIGMVWIGGIGKWAWTFGPAHLLFDLIFCVLWGMTLRNVYLSYKKATAGLRINLKNMLVALVWGIITPTITDIILPSIGYYSLNWIGPISGAIWIFIISYSIIKYRQMSVRVVFTEVLAIAMLAVFFINIFVTEPLGIWPRVGTFLAFLILVYFLIKGILKESKQREQLNDLNQHLSQRVAEQTIEIRKSYEAEKKARMELEKLNDAKDQFIMITQHHLRTPLTSVIWGLESVLNNAHGAVSSRVRDAITGMKTSTDRLMQIVNDFLSITAIKIGTNILNLSEQSLKPAIEYIVRQLQPEIKHMNVAISYPHEDASWPKLRLDHDKMREILLIILENAIRYNETGGKVDITTTTHAGSFELVIENTGIGISPEEEKKIGSALFYRGQSARKSHPIGMGIGLAVVKAIVRAHHGNFEIKSSGQGHGARVTISVPLESR